MAGRFPKTTGKISQIAPNSSFPNQGTSNLGGTVRLAYSYNVIDKDGLLIGYITQIQPQKSRTTERIRHLGYADSGRVLEQAPKPEDITLNVTGFGLYNDQEDGSLVQRLGGTNTAKAMSSLEEQHEGFDIVVEVKNPKTGAIVDYKIYQDCWLQNHNEPVNVTTATVAESATIIASRCIRPNDYSS